MMIHDITAIAGKHKARKRVGRGQGSGNGKQSGRGHKGDGSRSGHFTRHQFEGGQMPYFRRLPKFGFTNVQFKTQFWVVNLREIVAAPEFAKGGSVTPEALAAAKLIRDTSRDVKVLGDLGESGKLSVKLDVNVARVSDKARELITGAGGSVTESGTRRDKVRGVDRNAEDRSPKNLTKKLRRPSGARAIGG